MIKTRLKFIGLLITSTILIVIRDPISICISSGIVFIVCLRLVPYRVLWQRVYPILIIGLFVIGYQLVFQTMVPFQSRLLDGSIQALRLILLSVLVFVFTQTTSVSEIVSALSFLPGKLCLLITISFALIPAILREITIIRIAQQVRGFAPRKIHIIRSVFPVLIPLLNRTLTRAEHIAIVLETRGFGE
jgi:energy-coupling factor transporter transmembrane protein EcfT